MAQRKSCLLHVLRLIHRSTRPCSFSSPVLFLLATVAECNVDLAGIWEEVPKFVVTP